MAETLDNLQSLSSLTALNATAALERGLAAIRAGQQEFDLGNVLTVDSVAVAVMLAWQRAAREAGFSLKLRKLPPALQSLTKLYGVCNLLFPDAAAAPATAAAHPVAGAPASAAIGLTAADLHHH